MLLKLIIVTISLTVHQSSAQYKKCCPIDEIVKVSLLLDNELSSHPLYSCVKVPKNINKINLNETSVSDNETSIESKTIENFEFIAFNVLTDNHSHWPSCGKKGSLSRHKLNEPLKVSMASSCVDILDDSYHIFSCSENGIDKIMSGDEQDIYKLKKCCPSGMSYDIFQRLCVVNNVSDLNDNFRDILHEKSVVFEHDKMLKCDDVLVEYHSSVHDLKVYGGSLFIANYNELGPDVFKRNYYCIESTLNSAIEQPIGMSKDHFHKKSSSKWIAHVCRKKDVCQTIPCVRKCCPLGKRMFFREVEAECEPHHQGIQVEFHSFLVRHEEEVMNVEVTEPKENEKHYISVNDATLFFDIEKKFFSNDRYCVDYFYFQDDDDTPQELDIEYFVCFDSTTANITHVYGVLLAISSFFLCITFLVYIFLPKLLNLHGKTVVCHVLSLFIGYSFLSVIQFIETIDRANCVLVAFIVYFGLLSSFSWLNVMCLDIYWTFGSVRASQGFGRTKEMKRFVYFSLYAWGFPFFMTIFTSTMNIYDVLPDKYKPKMGDPRCWFNELASPGHLIFFLLPIGIQISINFILFVLTAIHCNRIKAEIHRMQSCDNGNQQRRKIFVADKAIFIMNIKLFCVMGVSWLLEIVATLYKKDSMWWSISDMFNCLQGVMVFLIFVFKKKVILAFRKKLGNRIRGMSSSPKTVTTMSTLDSYSTTVNRHTGRMLKSNSGSGLTTTFNSTKQ